MTKHLSMTNIRSRLVDLSYGHSAGAGGAAGGDLRYFVAVICGKSKTKTVTNFSSAFNISYNSLDIFELKQSVTSVFSLPLCVHAFFVFVHIVVCAFEDVDCSGILAAVVYGIADGGRDRFPGGELLIFCKGFKVTIELFY